MKIINLKAENIKRLVAVEITPDGNMVQITGKNGQGKTSILDSIWWALSGQTNIQGNPIRRGENRAKIRLGLGETSVELMVTRTFKKDEDGNTSSSITVENAEGTAIRQPQTMLDRLLGELSFDPLAFSRMTKKEQFDQLRVFVPDVDFDAIEKAHQADYDKRTDINRRALESRTIAKNIFVALPQGAVRADESALVNEMEAAGKHNLDIATRKANREKMALQGKQRLEDRNRLVAEAGENERKIKYHEEQILLLRQIVKDRIKESEVAMDESASIGAKLATAPPLPAPIDVSSIKAKITEARELNQKFDLLDKQKEHIKRAEQEEAESEEITRGMNERIKDKNAKIAQAKLPVEGLGFGDGEILFNGIQFNQASDAEQLRVSIGIAMALNPKLRVIRVRDGSLLDEDSLKLLAKMAELNDFQVWCERVDSTGKVGFVIEDGHIKVKEAV